MTRAALPNLFSNKSPVPYVPKKKGYGGSFGFGQARPTYDSAAAMDQYGVVGTLFAIVECLSTETGNTEWKLCKKVDAQAKQEYREFDKRQEVDTHAAIKLLRKPNPFMGTAEFLSTLQQHMDLTGEAWVALYYATKGGKQITAAGPLEMWPMRPDRVRVVTDSDNFLTGYVYKLGDEEVPLSTHEVIRMRMPSPLDPYRGMGPVQAIMVDLDSQRYSSEYNRNFFLNSAEPGGIIEIEARLDDDEFREMTARWREQHQGVANAHRVAILEQGKWIDRRYTMKDMSFVELAGLNQEKIREVYRFPKAMLGGTDDVNKAVAEASERQLAKYHIRPRCRRIRSMLNDQLLPLFGTSAKGLEFDFEDPVPADRAADSQERFTKAQAAALMVQAGFDATETCETFGLPPIRWSKPEPAPKPDVNKDSKPESANPDQKQAKPAEGGTAK